MPVEPKLRWPERPWFIRAIGLWWLAFGIAVLATENHRAPVGTLVVSFALGVTFGVFIWLFDRWWGDRENVRAAGRFARRAPTIAVVLGGTLLATWWDINHGANGTVLVFGYTTIAMLYFLVLPRFERHRVERRALQAAVPARPDTTP